MQAARRRWAAIVLCDMACQAMELIRVVLRLLHVLHGLLTTVPV